MAPVPPATPAKPPEVFDRDAEWDALVGFAADPRPGPGLGMVSGRLRQGKTFLLDALTTAMDGFSFGAQEAVEADSLRQLGDRLAAFTATEGAGPTRNGVTRDRPPQDWAEAVDALLALGEHRPVPVVIDGFPQLVRQSPSLPAVLHAAYGRFAEAGAGSRTRLLLCGSTQPMMRRLFGGPAPLKGLLGLELIVRPFDFRQAARFWGIDDPRLALRVYAVVGGTPAYRGAYSGGTEPPSTPEEFDAWVCGTVLNARTPLFQEARLLLHEATDREDRALCHSVLTAVALGAATPGEVAGRLRTSLADVSHALALLQDCALLRADTDAFRPHVTRLYATDPLLAFEHAVVRPLRPPLAHGDAAGVWPAARDTFESTVAPARFAEVCRAWARDHASPGTFGGTPARVGHGSLPSAGGGPGLDAEVVVRGEGDGGRPGAVLSVGRARWGEVMDVHHLEVPRRMLGLLAERGDDVGGAVPACYSSAGFGPALRAAEEAGEVLLVGPERLYHGS
ncbi:ATP-binding protein [Streptomyces sp. NPDC047928]|uniref:AAA family ATPase n=1 Tax=unclassified Streptomyces TaxID=2593676 RepID=UPI0037101238